VTAPPSAAGDGLPYSELRLAVAFTGGVSLAVWMGGMAREMNVLLAASRDERGEQVKPPCSAESQRVRDGYQRLLHLLRLRSTAYQRAPQRGATPSRDRDAGTSMPSTS